VKLDSFFGHNSSIYFDLTLVACLHELFHGFRVLRYKKDIDPSIIYLMEPASVPKAYQAKDSDRL
jgi:hypothetical protein